MVEMEHILVEERVTYDGIFSIDELHKLITDWLIQKKYDRFDKMHTESVKPDGKYIDIEMEPYKSIDDYTKFIIRIRIYASKLQEVTVEQDGRKKRMNNGKIQIVLDGFIKTDWQGRMDSKAMYSFIRTLYDKYIYKSETHRNEQQFKRDFVHLKETMANYLNLMKVR